MNEKQQALFLGFTAPRPQAKGRQGFKRPTQIYGFGPENKTCKTCLHRYTFVRGRRYYKCTQWHLTGSVASDIRLSWPACGKYVELDDEEKA
jgi:hypothetical protein